MAEFEDLVQQEHEQSLAKKRGIIEAYNRDALGSYDQAQQRAYDNALPDDQFAPVPGAVYGLGNAANFIKLGKRADYQFIQKVRSIAERKFAQEQEQHQNEMISAYNLKRAPEGPIGSFVDMPVRIIDGMGRNLGSSFAEARNDFAASASGLFGSDSGLNRAVDSASGFLDRAEAFTDDIGKIVTQSPWIEKRLANLRDKANTPVKMKDVNGFFDGMNNVFSSHFRKILGDFADILDEWWHDPRTLCCLIKTLAALAVASAKKIQVETGVTDIDIFGKTVNIGDLRDESFGSIYKRVVNKYFSGDMQITELTGTREFFDKMITILKLIRGFLSNELNFNFGLNLDLGLMMNKASVGALMALLAALQQMLEDKIYAKMMGFIKKYVREEIRQCLPFEKLLRLLADWMTGPDGLFKYIEQFVDAYMIGFAQNMQYGFDEGMKQKMLDLAALDKLIALLERLRDAMLNLELCMEADFNETPAPGDDGFGLPTEQTVGNGPNNYGDLVDAIRGNKPTGFYKSAIPSRNEMYNFFTNRLGFTDDVANQILDTSATSSNLNGGLASGGPNNTGADGVANLTTAIGDCARTLNPQRIEDLAKLIADWEII